MNPTIRPAGLLLGLSAAIMAAEPNRVPAPGIAGAKAGGQQVSVTLDEVPLADALAVFRRSTGRRITCGAKLIRGKRTIAHLKDVPWQNALGAILADHGLVLHPPQRDSEPYRISVGKPADPRLKGVLLGPAIETPPSGQSSDERLAMTLDEVPLVDIVRMYTRVPQANITVNPDLLRGTATVNFTDKTWTPSLRAILATRKLALRDYLPGSRIHRIVRAERADLYDSLKTRNARKRPLSGYEPCDPKEDCLSIALDNVPLMDVVRMFARISGGNFVCNSTSLAGSTTVRIFDKPWRLSFDAILACNGLASHEFPAGSGVHVLRAFGPPPGHTLALVRALEEAALALAVNQELADGDTAGGQRLCHDYIRNQERLIERAISSAFPADSLQATTLRDEIRRRGKGAAPASGGTPLAEILTSIARASRMSFIANADTLRAATRETNGMLTLPELKARLAEHGLVLHEHIPGSEIFTVIPAAWAARSRPPVVAPGAIDLALDLLESIDSGETAAARALVNLRLRKLEDRLRECLQGETPDDLAKEAKEALRRIAGGKEKR